MCTSLDIIHHEKDKRNILHVHRKSFSGEKMAQNLLKDLSEEKKPLPTHL